MIIDALVNELDLTGHLLAMVIGMPRLTVLMMVAPFMGGSVVTGQLRMTVAFACYLLAHPLVYAQLPQASGIPLYVVAMYGALIVKETLIGLLLGFSAGIIFWAFQAAGFFIDNQRGASMAEEADPLSGEQTSPLGSLLFQGITFLFYAGGMFMAFLNIVYASYIAWPPAQLLPVSLFTDIRLPLFFAEQVGRLMLLMLLLAGPITVACLLADVSLGLINRFASQLNVYVLAMPIKSGVAALLLVFYFEMLMRDALPLMRSFHQTFVRLQMLLP